MFERKKLFVSVSSFSILTKCCCPLYIVPRVFHTVCRLTFPPTTAPTRVLFSLSTKTQTTAGHLGGRGNVMNPCTCAAAKMHLQIIDIVAILLHRSHQEQSHLIGPSLPGASIQLFPLTAGALITGCMLRKWKRRCCMYPLCSR